MTNDRLIERVKKLLTLAANNPEVEEAAAAAAKAQEMIEEYSIDVALLSAQEAPEEAKLQDVEEHTVYRFGSRVMAHWIKDLAHAVCQAAGLYSWSGWEGDLRAIKAGGDLRVMKAAGPITELLAAEVLIDWLVSEVNNLWRLHKEGGEAEKGRAYANSFRMGCAYQIGKRVRHAADEKRKDAERRASMTREEAYQLALEEGDTETLVSLDSGDQRYALAVVQKAFEIVKLQKEANKDWAKKKHKFKTLSHGGSTRSYTGWERGVKAGNRAQIKAPRRLK